MCLIIRFRCVGKFKGLADLDIEVPTLIFVVQLKASSKEVYVTLRNITERAFGGDDVTELTEAHGSER